MNKIKHFEVTTESWDSMVLKADEYIIRGEYVEFFEAVGGEDSATDDPYIPGLKLATLPSRRLLTVMHRPQEVRPVYEDG